MITDADRALVRNIKAGKVADGAWDAMHHREEAYALGRIEGAKERQEAVEATLDKCGEPCPQCGDAIRALSIGKTIAENKP